MELQSVRDGQDEVDLRRSPCVVDMSLFEEARSVEEGVLGVEEGECAAEEGSEFRFHLNN